MIPHAEPSPPKSDALGNPLEPISGPARGHAYLEWAAAAGPDPPSAPYRGPQYEALGLYDRRAHLDRDPTKPLLASEEARQQYNWKMFRRGQLTRASALKRVRDASGARFQHELNMSLDLDVEVLSDELRTELLLQGADLEPGGKLQLPIRGDTV